MEAANSPNHASYVAACRNIYQMYIAPASPHEVNIADDVRQSLSDVFERTSKDPEDPAIHDMILIDALKSVYSLMSRDSYPRFLSSPAYLDQLKKCE